MPPKKKPRPAKLPDVLARARERLTSGNYRDTRHATERKAERDIILSEIQQVIRGGYGESSKDAWKEAYKAWNYAIRGRTLDDRDLRIVVSFDEEDFLLIVTAIDLDAGK